MVEVLFKHTWTPSYLPAGGVLPHFPNSEGRALPSPAPSPVPLLRPRLHAVETVGEIRH